jgi:hypothetical protein
MFAQHTVIGVIESQPGQGILDDLVIDADFEALGAQLGHFLNGHALEIGDDGDAGARSFFVQLLDDLGFFLPVHLPLLVVRPGKQVKALSEQDV